MILSKIFGIEEDKLKKLQNKGFMRSSVPYEEKIFETYQKYISQGKPTTDAVVQTGEDHNLSDRQVFRIIKKFH